MWCCECTPVAAKATVEEHVEDLFRIKPILPKAGASSVLPVAIHGCALCVAIPIIGRSLVSITQAAEGLRHSCNNKNA